MNKFFITIKINRYLFFFKKKFKKCNYIWLFGLKGFFFLKIKKIYLIKKHLFLICFFKKFSFLRLLLCNIEFLYKFLNFSFYSHIQIWGKGFRFEYYLRKLHIRFGFSNFLFYNLFFLHVNYKLWFKARILFLEFKNKIVLMNFFCLLENLKYRDFYTGRGIYLKNRFCILKKYP